jgi:hypothetical protein
LPSFYAIVQPQRFTAAVHVFPGTCATEARFGRLLAYHIASRKVPRGPFMALSLVVSARAICHITRRMCAEREDMWRLTSRYGIPPSSLGPDSLVWNRTGGTHSYGCPARMAYHVRSAQRTARRSI